MLALEVDPNLLNLLEYSPLLPPTWTAWEKKSFNLHRGLLHIPAEPDSTFADLEELVRQCVQQRFRPGWWRGFAFGTVIAFKNFPYDIHRTSEYIDCVNRLRGVWQWTICYSVSESMGFCITIPEAAYLAPIQNAIRLQVAAVVDEFNTFTLKDYQMGDLREYLMKS